MQKFNEINQTLEDSKFPEFLGSLLNWSFVSSPHPCVPGGAPAQSTTRAEEEGGGAHVSVFTGIS